MPKTCINRDVLPIYKAFESKSIQLIYLDTMNLSIPSSSALISAPSEGLRSRFGRVEREKSTLELHNRVLRIFNDLGD